MSAVFDFKNPRLARKKGEPGAPGGGRGWSRKSCGYGVRRNKTHPGQSRPEGTRRKTPDRFAVPGGPPVVYQDVVPGGSARLGLARAYALDAAKDSAARDKARAAYQDFLTLWKDADPDIPIYKQAKAE